MIFYLMGEQAAVMQTSRAISLPCQRRIWSLARSLKQHANYLDVIPGMNNLTVIFDPLHYSGSTVLEHLKQSWEEAKETVFEQREIAIPVHYGGEQGPDLHVVASHAGLSYDEVVQRHSKADYLVYFLGFQPGFAYLGGLPPELHTPRRASPRLKVAAGSVGIGGAQTGIYPAASPGGWQLIGHTSITLFNPQESNPASACLFQPGDIVRFTIASMEG
jgi:KipI family sensor histidine kinase inhibitor